MKRLFSSFVLYLIILFIPLEGKDFILKLEKEFEVDYGVTSFDYHNGKFYLSNSLLNQIVICNEKGEEVEKNRGKKVLDRLSSEYNLREHSLL